MLKQGVKHFFCMFSPSFRRILLTDLLSSSFWQPLSSFSERYSPPDVTATSNLSRIMRTIISFYQLPHIQWWHKLFLAAKTKCQMQFFYTTFPSKPRMCWKTANWSKKVALRVFNKFMQYLVLITINLFKNKVWNSFGGYRRMDTEN